MTISNEVVEAAARAAAKDEDASNWDDEPDYYRNGWCNRIQVALEAAVPIIRAEAWDEGWLAVWTFMTSTDPRRERPTNPYRSRAVAERGGE